MSALTQEYRHTPVLLKACLEYTQPETKHIFVDATLGGAGHSVEVTRRLGASFGTPAAEGLLIGIDQDEEALVAAKARLEAVPAQERAEFRLLRGNFGDLDALLESVPVPGIDAILFDLGVSSHQIDDTSRGFSFKEEAPLDMRMDPGKQTLTAAEIINTYNAADLTRIIRDFSDEKWAARIASFVCEARAKAPIETSGQLVEIIKAAIPASARREGGHPAKRTFQALRIEVNDELGVLARGLEAAVRWLNPGGRMAVISYHSLEDRIVKDLFARMANRCTCPPDLPVCVCGKPPVLRVITRKPCVPSATEIDENPRARSAKLRVAEKCE